MLSFSDCTSRWSKELQWTNDYGTCLPCFLLVHGRVYKTKECPVPPFVRLNLQEYSHFNCWLAMFTPIMYTHYLLQMHKQCTKLVPLSCSSSLHNPALWENAVHHHNHKHKRNHRHHSSLHNHLHNDLCIITILVPKWIACVERRMTCWEVHINCTTKSSIHMYLSK